MKRSRLWWLPAAVPLAWLPLAAQETAPQAPPGETPAPPSDASAPAREAPAEAEEADGPPPKEAGPEEQVSADNNLSFPVDI